MGSNDHSNPEQAKISHNPGTNMVTIRNPAFAPPPPKVEQTPQQQAAIIKLAENGMVTIRSPALQQAINAGLTPPLKPDYIVKGGVGDSKQNNGPMQQSSPDSVSSTVRGSNGLPVLSDFRKRLAKSDNGPSSSMYNPNLPSIQISKVTNGQTPNIPESGINLRGTSVTLTKIRNTDQQRLQTYEEPRINSVQVSPSGEGFNGAGTSKNRRKRNRRNPVRQAGDDWNLVGKDTTLTQVVEF